MADKSFRVSGARAGERIDKFVVTEMPGLGRAGARRLFEEGRVRVNGKRPSKGDLTREGDEVLVGADEASVPGALPQPEAPLEVRLETSALVVVDKPPGQPTAPLRDGEIGTLANALVGHYPEMDGVGYALREPGIVHRLDNDTSGLVLAARTKRAFEVLANGLKAGSLDKAYLLVCRAEGLAASGSIEIPIAHHPKDQKRMYACAHPRDVQRYAPKPAHTEFRVLRTDGPWALVEARAGAALRHQIRVHMAAIGHPLASDALYDGPPAAALARHALHASYIAWKGDATVPAFAVRSSFPPDLAAAFPAFAGVAE
jgi:23S rRNA pseudouridine1911/1915/1917 synthase